MYIDLFLLSYLTCEFHDDEIKTGCVLLAASFLKACTRKGALRSLYLSYFVAFVEEITI
jgi:hypothetical protein